jgi:ATP-dependent Clp protease ATP-binding subunit ClpC
VLAPLGLSIVGKDAPRGEQFLMVRGEAERLVVEFVDFSTAEEPPEVAQAEGALAAAEDRRSTVVRRYRDDPAPLVTDRVHGWRTGRLDRVLEGEFDVMR